ncbi:unnamed protein product [Closterium sp. NIES-65]|nr:unnamed protein product [Closterium sp. NIES-65]
MRYNTTVASRRVERGAVSAESGAGGSRGPRSVQQGEGEKRGARAGRASPVSTITPSALLCARGHSIARPPNTICNHSFQNPPPFPHMSILASSPVSLSLPSPEACLDISIACHPYAIHTCKASTDRSPLLSTTHTLYGYVPTGFHRPPPHAIHNCYSPKLHNRSRSLGSHECAPATPSDILPAIGTFHLPGRLRPSVPNEARLNVARIHA